MNTQQKFLTNTTFLQYSERGCQTIENQGIRDLVFTDKKDVKWVNTYSHINCQETKDVIINNRLDDFLINLIGEDITNKVIDLDGVIFIAMEVLKIEDNALVTEKMVFVANGNFVWSIQEREDDDFHSIRNRLKVKNARVLKKKADYLLFLLLECIIDNYQTTLNQLSASNDRLFESTKTKPTPEFMSVIEDRKQKMFRFKKATRSLRDNLTKLEQIEMADFSRKYFYELKEQANDLISDVDFELQELESQINLIFSIQGHHLNEVMKTLTIFSMIFTPLSFLAGLYGMNFDNMPELKSQNGYFILLGIMGTVTITIVYYLKKKNWI